MCGENRTRGVWDPGFTGSSPRVRGKRLTRRPSDWRGRLIPACAGKTRTRARTRRGSWAHPRVCGENCGRGITRVFPPGSSPRVRGKPGGSSRRACSPRLIPACAGKTRPCARLSSIVTAHPRVCGENFHVQRLRRRAAGSSPRVRGKPPPAQRPAREGGLIPACAGKTAHSGAAPLGAWAHPRVCGENFHIDVATGGERGSSPRVRGKLAGRGSGLRLGRLIPACAGKTARAAYGLRTSRAHPRVCGENIARPKLACGIEGSSPRVRGKHPLDALGARAARLIPACAGKTGHHLPPVHGRRAHPRVCGENPSFSAMPSATAGSSPRVRGKRGIGGQRRYRQGLIPACAGKTTFRWPGRRSRRAHPRVCGENLRLIAGTGPQMGSSPRVRGKLVLAALGDENHRLIPACAGKTSSLRGTMTATWAHPRVCGENTYNLPNYVGELGSSPRVRGKRVSPPGPLRGPRLIPACAGKTLSTRKRPRPIRAHPRVCGENPDNHLDSGPHGGSSPRVRGKRASGPRGGQGTRLIPACAGKTPYLRRSP